MNRRRQAPRGAIRVRPAPRGLRRSAFCGFVTRPPPVRNMRTSLCRRSSNPTSITQHMFKLKSSWLALLSGALLVASPVLAQDSGALIDLLVKKGIVTDQEAETLRADLSRDF